MKINHFIIATGSKYKENKLQILKEIIGEIFPESREEILIIYSSIEGTLMLKSKSRSTLAKRKRNHVGGPYWFVIMTQSEMILLLARIA